MALELHDSEILEAEKVLRILKDKASSPQNYQHFENEILSRFWDIGLKVDVKWWESNVEGVLMPEVEILDRVQGEFDPEKQVHEVVNNVVNLPDAETGFIKTDPKEIEFLQSGKQERKDKKNG